ncbi:hypothetical protein [Flaviaesturariibacter flavus]|nr:hypothetical protein [Flaviaesturariibacter flavus]
MHKPTSPSSPAGKNPWQLLVQYLLVLLLIGLLLLIGAPLNLLKA